MIRGTLLERFEVGFWVKCSARVSCVGLFDWEPYSDLLNRTRNPSKPYSDKEIPPQKSSEVVALPVGFSPGNPPKLPDFHRLKGTRNRAQTPPDIRVHFCCERRIILYDRNQSVHSILPGIVSLDAKAITAALLQRQILFRTRSHRTKVPALLSLAARNSGFQLRPGEPCPE